MFLLSPIRSRKERFMLKRKLSQPSKRPKEVLLVRTLVGPVSLAPEMEGDNLEPCQVVRFCFVFLVSFQFCLVGFKHCVFPQLEKDVTLKEFCRHWVSLKDWTDNSCFRFWSFLFFFFLFRI